MIQSNTQLADQHAAASHQLSTFSKTGSHLPALSENRQAQNKLDSLIAGCFALQRLYGKPPESATSMATITNMFHAMLGKYPAEQVTRAFELWMERGQQFPTPADIISLIKRKGKPPLKESDIIAIRKKDGENRTRDEWDMLAEWDAQHSESFSEFTDDTQKHDALLADNISLRKQLASAKDELARVSALLTETRIAKGIEQPKPDMQTKIARTAQHMRETGASQDDIDEFLMSNGVTP